jgi:glycosyltransferase involved in cell wall biosynthesis
VRILIGTDTYAPKIDGVSDTAGIVAQSLQARGHDVRVLAPRPGPSQVQGISVTRVNSLGLPFYSEVRATFPFFAAGKLKREFQPDAAIVLTPGPIGVATTRIAASLPLVNVFTTDIARYLRLYRLGVAGGPVESLMRWMSHQAIATLCPTGLVRDELVGKGYVRTQVWGRGVDRTLFNPARRDMAWRGELFGPTERPVVLFVGRLAREKRLDDFAQAAKMLDGVSFLIVGDGPQRRFLESAMAGKDAVFTGFLRGESLARAFASSDVFAFPSDTETFGQVVLQAMASGVPPVVVRGTAPAEFVEDGVAGLHVPPRSPGALSAAIRDVLATPGLRARLSHGAWVASSNFSWEALLDRMEQLLTTPVKETQSA